MDTIFISYANNEGSISLQYAHSENCELLKEFQDEVDSFKTISIENSKAYYCTELALVDIAKSLWKQLGDTPVDDDGEGSDIDEEFLHFDKGTPVYDIWDWFESEFNISIGKDLL